MEREETIDKLLKTTKNSDKTVPKLLKYLKKIESVGDYDDYIKTNFSIPLIEWIYQVLIIRPIPIFLCLLFLTYLITTPKSNLVRLMLAEGISLLWFLIIEFIKEIKNSWRN